MERHWYAHYKQCLSEWTGKTKHAFGIEPFRNEFIEFSRRIPINRTAPYVQHLGFFFVFFSPRKLNVCVRQIHNASHFMSDLYSIEYLMGRGNSYHNNSIRIESIYRTIRCVVNRKWNNSCNNNFYNFYMRLPSIAFFRSFVRFVFASNNDSIRIDVNSIARQSDSAKNGGEKRTTTTTKKRGGNKYSTHFKHLFKS